MKHLIAGVALIAAVMCATATADDPGRIQGTVTMADGKTPAANQNVAAVDLNTGKIVARVKTDDKGAFQVDGLPLGRYQVLVEDGSASADVSLAASGSKVKLVQQADTRSQGVRRGGTNRKKLIINLIGGVVAGVVVVVGIILIF